MPASFTACNQQQASSLSSNNGNTAKMNDKKNESGITGAGKTVTSTLGNTVGGLTNTVGGVLGAASRGIGETVTGATGGVGKPLGDGIANIGTGVEGGIGSVSQGVKDAGEWKTNPK
ncbi:hypothetical protein B0T22DRAFT_477153 [Podospora appendiculata]|uniref:Uncharacterized protein n=1 Tax=Podospora appendiculata TaxID=314037 RepID=A0AAE0XJL4_9PEZI|nr:hypothetical protein B0T22DRAFT_477153 [Podospora appendiculata]